MVVVRVVSNIASSGSISSSNRSGSRVVIIVSNKGCSWESTAVVGRVTGVVGEVTVVFKEITVVAVVWQPHHPPAGPS